MALIIATVVIIWATLWIKVCQEMSDIAKDKYGNKKKAYRFYLLYMFFAWPMYFFYKN